MSRTETEITKRENAIKKLLDEEVISDQKKIVEMLHLRYSIETTQAVVSRDLKRLGVIKKAYKSKRIYANPERNVVNEIIQMGLLDIQHNESLIVISTLPGLASFVGDTIDASSLEIQGCLSGENIVFVSPKSTKNIHEVYLEIIKLFKLTDKNTENSHA